MRILVTGGAGFIGSNLVDMLLDLGHEVSVLDNFSTGRWENLTTAWGGPPVVPPPGISMSSFWTKSPHRPLLVQPGTVTWQHNITDVMAWKPEVVFHLAAQIDVRVSAVHPVQDHNVNVGGTLRMLQASVEAGVSRFVFVSSAAIFGDRGAPRIDPGLFERIQPISPYGASKAAADIYVQLYDRQGAEGAHNLCTTTVVLSNVYGPRQAPGTGAVNIFARALLAGEPVTLYGDGGNVRDYVFVTDACRALCWAAGVLTPGRGMGSRGRTLLGTGVGTTDAELLQVVAAEVAAQGGPLRAGDVLPIIKAPRRIVDIRRMVFPASDGMTSTTLADGVAVTVQEIRKEMGL